MIINVTCINNKLMAYMYNTLMPQYYSKFESSDLLFKTAVQAASTCVISVETAISYLSLPVAAYIWCRAVLVLGLVTVTNFLSLSLAELLQNMRANR